DGERTRRARDDGGAGGAGKGRRLVDGQRERLGGVGGDAVDGPQGQRIRPAGPGLRGAAERRRAVVGVGGGGAGRQGGACAWGRPGVGVRIGVGAPRVVTVNEPLTPVAKVTALALVNRGGCVTVRLRDWVASGDTPLVAEMRKLYRPAVPTSGVPENVAVPSWL